LGATFDPWTGYVLTARTLDSGVSADAGAVEVNDIREHDRRTAAGRLTRIHTNPYLEMRRDAHGRRSARHRIS
jgi:YD repeat-containing protein